MENGPDFHQKRKNLFDCLDQAEKSLNSDSSLAQRSTITLAELTPRSRENENKRRKTVIRSISPRKESIFKRPELPIQKCMPMRHVPDYKKNPHKWKKYSLEDADCSDRTNTAAAFDFLREIEKRKEDEEEEKDVSEEPSKIVFKKSTKLRGAEASEENDGSKLKGSKVVMPEYVVGQKKVKKGEGKKAKPERTSGDKQKELKLDHLMDDEEEDDDVT